MKSKTKTYRFGIDRPKKTVYFGGTFDIFSWGHCTAIRMCRDCGNFIIIGVNTDNLVRSYKKREPLFPYYQRRYVVECNKYVNEIIPVEEFSPIAILMKYRPDVFCVGSEFAEIHKEEMAFVKSYGGEVKVIPEFRGVIHTSDVKRKLLKEAQEEKGF